MAPHSDTETDTDADLEQFTARAREWLAAHAREAPPNYGAIVPPELVDAAKVWQGQLHAAGFAGIHWPAEHGGRGLTVAHTAAWSAACAEVNVPAFLNMVGHVLTAGSLLAFGTPEQQHRFLPGIASGAEVWCQLFSEPGAGSDLASLATTATRDGDAWVLQGQKVWCSNGRVADFGICLARTRSVHDAPKHKGISFFLVPMHAPGVQVRILRQMTGGSEFDEVFLDEVRIPADALLGPEHEGWSVAMATLTNERGHIGSMNKTIQKQVTAMAAGLDASDPVLRQRVVELVVRGRTLVALGSRQGPVASVASSLAKLGVTELLFDAAVLRADLAGPFGMLQGPVADGLLGAPGGRIAGGTTQVQKNIIAERILGLPKDPT
ncbi:MAG TPA: acyl-CoA dehydrogenase family protein [Acidimicrobiales bacterium]|nr:acyl-CoA dehydrogenase family protein [Acidimicrobiales bacterium]